MLVIIFKQELHFVCKIFHEIQWDTRSCEIFCKCLIAKQLSGGGAYLQQIKNSAIYEKNMGKSPQKIFSLIVKQNRTSIILQNTSYHFWKKIRTMCNKTTRDIFLYFFHSDILK